MKLRLNASINVAKITKSRIKTTDKRGNPFKSGAKYLEVTIFIDTEADKYGNNMSMVEVISKEEKAQGSTTNNYIANGKITFNSGPTESASAPAAGQTKAPAGTALSGDPDDLPF